MIARSARLPDRLTEGPGTTRAPLQSTWRRHVGLPILALPTVLLAGWVIVVWKFNGLYGQDPFAYYDFGVGPLRHSLLDGAPLSAMFWPLGYPILITLTSFVVGPVTGAAQMVNVLAGGATVCFTYLLGRDLLLQAGASPHLSRRAGVLGALLLGVTGRMIESNVLIMADSVALATATLSAWALVRWCADRGERGPHIGWLALAATALAWSVITRWGQALLLGAWLVATLPMILSRRRHMVRWRDVGWAILPAILILGVQLWLVFTVRSDPNVSVLPFAGDLVHVNGAGIGWSLAHLFQHRFVNGDGVQQYPWPNALYYAGGAFLLQYLTPIFLPAVILGVIVAAVSYPRSLPLLLSWPAILLVFDAGLAQQNPRYILAALPPVALLAGLGSAVVWERLRTPWRPLGILVMGAALVAVAAIGLRGVGTLNAERNSDLQVATWTAAREPVGAATLTFGLTLTLQHSTHLHVLDLSVLSKSQLQRLAARHAPLYLLVQENAMNGQFAARPPGINYRQLKAAPGLIRLGELHGYTLARVNTT
ncbi:MAG TPA: hypothetical protein VIO57_12290 [Chloroflexota bacterium]